MDIPGKLIIGGIVILFILLIYVIGFETSAPLFTRTKFDGVCNHYLNVMVADGGLTSSQKQDFKKELESMNLENIVITAPESADWGDEVTLQVTADVKFINVSYLKKEESTKPILYRNKTRIFGIEN